MRKLIFLLLAIVIFPTAWGASTQKFNFTMQNNTALNFENGSYIVEVIEIAKPLYVKVNMTSGGVSRINSLFDREAPITFNEIKLSSSSITDTVDITIEFPSGWAYPKRYTIVRPVAPVGVPNIVLTKSVDKTNLNAGDVVEFKIIVQNIGNATAYNLTFSEPLPKGFSSAAGSRFPPAFKDKLDANDSQELYYALKAVESGSFNIEPATVKYGSRTSTSNSLAITVSGAVEQRSNLNTVVSVDKTNVHTGDLIKVTVKITNTGNAATKFVDIDFTPPGGMEVVENDLEKVPNSIAPDESLSYRITLKAEEAGNYTIHLRTVYNDASAGMPSDSEQIVVSGKERSYLYILVPIVIIVAGLVLFTIKRHKEYSY